MLLCLILISQPGKHHNLRGYLKFQTQKNPDVTADEVIKRLFENFGFQAKQTLVCTFAQKILDFQDKSNGTGEGTRTPTPKALGPKPSASTNSATPAHMSYLDSRGSNKGLRRMRGKNAKNYNISQWL